MEKSPSDELYYKLFGEYPSKSGIALERLATIAYNEIMANKAWVDQRIKGRYSDSVYQLDGLIATNEGQKMLEAKDYSIRGSKVGRDDLQKLSGALLDIDNISKGVFASATDYTKPAKQYAESTIKMPNAKPIELYEIRPSTEEDEKGRVKKICIQMNIVSFHQRILPLLQQPLCSILQFRLQSFDLCIKLLISNFLILKFLLFHKINPRLQTAILRLQDKANKKSSYYQTYYKKK